MSYRAFKRLLGETSLERKCRFLFGAGILLLITSSFWLYAYLTEQLAYEQAVPLGKLLVNWLVIQKHLQAVNVQEGTWNRPGQEDEGGEAPQEGRPLTADDWQHLTSAIKELS